MDNICNLLKTPKANHYTNDLIDDLDETLEDDIYFQRVQVNGEDDSYTQSPVSKLNLRKIKIKNKRIKSLLIFQFNRLC